MSRRLNRGIAADMLILESQMDPLAEKIGNRTATQEEESQYLKLWANHVALRNDLTEIDYLATAIDFLKKLWRRCKP